jgi:hypothetical protein
VQYLGTQLVKIHKTWLIDERSECDVAERDKVAITMSHDNPWVFLLYYLKTKKESTFLKQWRGKLVSYILGNPNFRYFSVDLFSTETNFLLYTVSMRDQLLHKFQWQILVVVVFKNSPTLWCGRLRPWIFILFNLHLLWEKGTHLFL